jgi:hypothetical protein
LHAICPVASVVVVPCVMLIVAVVNARSVIISDHFEFGQSGAPATIRLVGGPAPIVTPIPV